MCYRKYRNIFRCILSYAGEDIVRLSVCQSGGNVQQVLVRQQSTPLPRGKVVVEQESPSSNPHDRIQGRLLYFSPGNNVINVNCFFLQNFHIQNYYFQLLLLFVYRKWSSRTGYYIKSANIRTDPTTTRNTRLTCFRRPCLHCSEATEKTKQEVERQAGINLNTSETERCDSK